MHRAVTLSILCLFVFALGAPTAHAQFIGIGDVAKFLGFGGTQTVYDPKAVAQAILLYKEIQKARKLAMDEAAFGRGIAAGGVQALAGVGDAMIRGNCAYVGPWEVAVNHGRIVDTAYDYVLSRIPTQGCDQDMWPTGDHRRAAARNRVLEDMLKAAITDGGQARQNARRHEANYDELKNQIGMINDPLVSQKDLLRLIAFATTVNAIAQRDVNRNTLAQTELLAAQITDQAELNRSLLNAELYRRTLLRSTRPLTLEAR